MIPGTDERYVQAGSKLRLLCRISKLVPPGSNPPVIRWLRNGTEVRTGNGNGGGTGWFGAAQPRVVVEQAKYTKVK